MQNSHEKSPYYKLFEQLEGGTNLNNHQKNQITQLKDAYTALELRNKDLVSEKKSLEQKLTDFQQEKVALEIQGLKQLAKPYKLTPITEVDEEQMPSQSSGKMSTYVARANSHPYKAASKPINNNKPPEVTSSTNTSAQSTEKPNPMAISSILNQM